MLRPNLAQDAPPTVLSVGGADYIINVDFRVWIGVLHDLRDLFPTPADVEQAMHNVDIIRKIEMDVFGSIIPAPAPDVLAAVTEFSKGYPEAPVSPDNSYGAQTYSFDWDLNYIIIAIMNQFGIDLSYTRTEPFHWWLFLAYFRALSGDHYILRLMEIRGYDGNDPKMKRQAQRFALPQEMTMEDQAMLDAFNAMMDPNDDEEV